MAFDFFERFFLWDLTDEFIMMARKIPEKKMGFYLFIYENLKKKEVRIVMVGCGCTV